MNKTVEFILTGLMIVGVFLGVLAIATIFALIGGLIGGTVFYFLWNWLVPLVFASAPTFTWLQSVGIWFLVTLIGRMIFGSQSSGSND